MKIEPRLSFIFALLSVIAIAALIPIPTRVSAHSGDVYSDCGIALIDGNVHPVEWSSASTQTFDMVRSGGGTPFTTTLYVMNSGSYLYMGITINDDEYTTTGEFLPQGDVFVINFDDDHSGNLYEVGNSVLAVSAGIPQFDDRYLVADIGSNAADTSNGGTSNGIGASARVDTLNHFELKFPLCSGDSLDFCLDPSDTVGFRLRYLDAQPPDGNTESVQYYPGNLSTSEADILIGICTVSENIIYLPLVVR